MFLLIILGKSLLSSTAQRLNLKECQLINLLTEIHDSVFVVRSWIKDLDTFAALVDRDSLKSSESGIGDWIQGARSCH